MHCAQAALLQHGCAAAEWLQGCRAALVRPRRFKSAEPWFGSRSALVSILHHPSLKDALSIREIRLGQLRSGGLDADCLGRRQVQTRNEGVRALLIIRSGFGSAILSCFLTGCLTFGLSTRSVRGG